MTREHKRPIPPKTFAEFEKYRQELFAEPFHGDNLHPIRFGLERTRFEMERLAALIQVAEGVEGVTIKSRLEGWKRQVRRLESAHKRFQNLAERQPVKEELPPIHLP